MRAVENTLAAEEEDPFAAEILGLHIEGPYINLKFKGGQPERGIRDPNFDEWPAAASITPISSMMLSPGYARLFSLRIRCPAP